MYATLDSMAKQFGVNELIAVTDTESPYTEQIVMDKLQLAMDAANSEVDGYLMGRYPVPVDPAPPFLIKLACDIARYHVVTGNGRITERDENRYDAACKTLRSISRGEIGLGASQVGGEPVKTASNEVLFTNGRPSDFGRRGW